jgi:DNA repair exonuclease SbcCD nuclease subunit
MERTKVNSKQILKIRERQHEVIAQIPDEILFGHKAKKKPDLILTSDWHLREDTPTCFTGDWNYEQWKAVEFVRHLQYKYKSPVIHAGDLFHHWKPSPALISQALFFLPNDFYTIYGQHDLPQHNWELRTKSGLHTLEVAGKIKVLKGYHYGQPIYTGAGSDNRFGIKMLVWHHLTYINPPFPGATGGEAQSILRKYHQFDLIVTGDNHQSFSTRNVNNTLVNPGSLTRQTADQIDFKPRVYLWYADTNTVEPVFIPIQKGMITREHIEKKEERDNRIEAFISKLDEEWGLSWSYPETLEQFFAKNKTKDSIKNIIYKAMENVT